MGINVPRGTRRREEKIYHRGAEHAEKKNQEETLTADDSDVADIRMKLGFLCDLCVSVVRQCIYRRGRREENAFNERHEIWFLGACPGPRSGGPCGEAFSMNRRFSMKTRPILVPQDSSAIVLVLALLACPGISGGSRHSRSAARSGSSAVVMRRGSKPFWTRGLTSMQGTNGAGRP